MILEGIVRRVAGALGPFRRVGLESRTVLEGPRLDRLGEIAAQLEEVAGDRVATVGDELGRIRLPLIEVEHEPGRHVVVEGGEVLAAAGVEPVDDEAADSPAAEGRADRATEVVARDRHPRGLRMLTP